MTRPRPGIGSELIPLGLILACLSGSLFLVISMHRRAVVPRKAPAASKPIPVVVAPPPVREEPPPPPALPTPPAPPPPPQEDPTKKVLARLAAAEAGERREAEKADRRAAALEAARQAALAESQRWRRREALIRAQVDGLAEKAQKLEQEADALALERDVLAHERDAAKAALAKARTSSSYAVLPHQGPNGTWRRPVIIECRDGTAKLQPNGPTFSLLELSGLMGMRTSPIVVAVARELIRIEAATAPDGAPVVPYIFFVVRPDGIRSYYEARARLEPLGIAFGYELVDQNWEIDYSDPDAPADRTDPAPAQRGSGPTVADSGGGQLIWPGEQPSQRGPSREHESSESFVWPTRPAGRVGDLVSSDPEGQEIGSGGRPNPGSSNGGGGGGGGGVDRPGRELAGGPGLRPFPNGFGTGGPGGAGGPNGLGAGEPNGLGAGEPGGLGTGELNGLGAGEPNGLGTGEPRGLGAGGPNGLGADGQGFDPLGRPRREPGPLVDQPDGLGGSRSRSATERAFGQRAGLVPLNADGLPRLEAAGSGDGSRGSASTDLGGPQPGIPTDKLAGAGTGNSNSASRGARSASQGSSGGASLGLDWPSSDSTEGGSGNPGSPSSGRTPIVPSDLAGGMRSGSSSHDSDGSEPRAMSGAGAGSQSHYEKPRKIEVPFEITVACGPNGVVIHPGGYRLSTKAIKENGLVAKELQAIVQLRRQVDPLIVPQPSIRFLVEPGGSDTYWEARRQTLLSKIDWPMSLQIGDTRLLGFAPRETWR